MYREDKDLIGECLKGNGKAFEEIVDKYYKTIYRLAFSIVRDRDNAEDITQSVFIKVYESLGSYNYKFKFFSWMYRITINESLNFSKKQSYTSELKDDYGTDEYNPGEIYLKTETGEKIQDALMQVDMLYRLPLVLKHFLNYSYKELSYLLGVPEKTVKSRLFTGRQLLKDILTKNKIFEK